MGVSEQTYFRWRAEYGSMKTDQVKRLKELELENGRLRRAVIGVHQDRRKLYLLNMHGQMWIRERVGAKT